MITVGLAAGRFKVKKARLARVGFISSVVGTRFLWASERGQARGCALRVIDFG